ncbi:MAG: BadF/BadG/BcrA/BcrD ATPase family protein [Halioglobus sp.]
MSSENFFLGVDGGGSKCKARLVNAAGELLGEGIAGPANPFQNLELACDSIVEAAHRALSEAGMDDSAMGSLVAGAGLAGVNIPRFHQLMSQWAHPFAQLYLATDIHIACLGAHGGADGAVIVAGTGSVGYSSVAGVGTSFGAHGFPFGDKGSGAWLGLEAMKALLLAADDLGPATSLVEAVEKHLGVKGLDIIGAMARATQRDYGALAPLVLTAATADDPVALGIVREGADYLSDLAERLLASGVEEFCMLGGLSPKIMPWMRPQVIAKVVAPRGQPDEGAVSFTLGRYAQEQA